PAAGAAAQTPSGPGTAGSGEAPQPTGRRRRALAAAAERSAAQAQEAGPRPVFALPPAEADRAAAAPAEGSGNGGSEPAAPLAAPGQAPVPVPVPGQGAPQDVLVDEGRHDAVPHDQAEDHTPPQPHPTSAPTGRRRRAVGQPAEAVGTAAQGGAGPTAPAQVSVQATTAQAATEQAAPVQAGQPHPAPVQAGQPQPAPVQAGQPQPAPGRPLPAEAAPEQGTPAQGVPAPQPWPAADDTPDAGTAVPANVAATPVPPHPNASKPAPGTPLPPEAAAAAQPLPAEAGASGAAAGAPVDPNSTQGRAISVRTLGQGVPFTRQAAQVQQPAAPTPSSATPPPHQTNGGRRRKLGTPPDPAARAGASAEQAARPHPPAEQPPVPAQPQPQAQPSLGGQPQPPPSLAGQSRLAPLTEGAGRSYAIGAPDENAAEGPEPLDGPGGAVEVADTPRPQPMDDELPPEPLDNPRRLLVWPAPDVTTQQALSDRGYRPVIVHSREEVDAQIAAFPAALFVDPLTGPITRTALQSLRQAAVAASVPVMVTAGLGQASREAAYGADPAVLLKALAPRDSEQHPPRVLLIEEHAEIALALTSTLERRGMQVARAASDADAVALAGDFRPNLVVMDLMQVHHRRAGIVDWLRANGQLNRTPLVVYTAAVDQADLPRLASGETVLFLAERSTSNEVQARIVDLLARIGTN
ncbi:nickel transporter, partial [Streptomyces sp. NPDC006356]